MKNSKAPRLGPGGKRLWNSVLSGWDVPEEQHQLLENVCRSQDRMDRLSRILEAEGPVQKNRFEVSVAHPAALLLRSEVANFSQLYRLLQLAAPSGGGDGPGRPAGWAPED